MPERRVSYQALNQGQLVGLKITAPSIQRLFIDAGLAFCDYRVSLDLVKDTTKKSLQVSGQNLPDLMRRWITALADIFNQEGFMPYRIVFTSFDGKKIEASLSGEKYESTRHGFAQPCTAIAAEPFSIGEAPGSEGEFAVSFFWEGA